MPPAGPIWRVESCLSCVRLRIRYFARYLFLNIRSRDFPEIGDNGQGRYATLHVLGTSRMLCKRAHAVRQRFPSRSLKPFPHTQGFDQTLMRTS